MDHDLIRAYMQQRREPGTPRFQREVEAMIGRYASVRAAHWPRQEKDFAGSGSDRLRSDCRCQAVTPIRAFLSTSFFPIDRADHVRTLARSFFWISHCWRQPWL
jgi:hypothetical protein